MDEKPATAEPVKKPRRRWYQFGLRTLLIGVALLSVLGAYVAHEAEIVRLRQDWITTRHVAHIITDHSAIPLMIRPTVAGDPDQSPSIIRRLLGDKSQSQLFVVIAADVRTTAVLFPEAGIFLIDH